MKEINMQNKNDIPYQYGQGPSEGNRQERDIISLPGHKVFPKYLDSKQEKEENIQLGLKDINNPGNYQADAGYCPSLALRYPPLVTDSRTNMGM
jgi:hypothetical protein